MYVFPYTHERGNCLQIKPQNFKNCRVLGSVQPKNLLYICKELLITCGLEKKDDS